LDRRSLLRAGGGPHPGKGRTLDFLAGQLVSVLPVPRSRAAEGASSLRPGPEGRARPLLSGSLGCLRTGLGEHLGRLDCLPRRRRRSTAIQRTETREERRISNSRAGFAEGWARRGNSIGIRGRGGKSAVSLKGRCFLFHSRLPFGLFRVCVARARGRAVDRRLRRKGGTVAEKCRAGHSRCD